MNSTYLTAESIREHFKSPKFGKLVGSYKRKWCWAIWLNYINKLTDAGVIALYHRFYN